MLFKKKNLCIGVSETQAEGQRGAKSLADVGMQEVSAQSAWWHQFIRRHVSAGGSRTHDSVINLHLHHTLLWGKGLGQCISPKCTQQVNWAAHFLFMFSNALIINLVDSLLILLWYQIPDNYWVSAFWNKSSHIIVIITSSITSNFCQHL